MLGKSNTAMLHGLECTMCNVECEVADGLPVFNMVGYLSSEVKEAKDRILSAVRQLGFQLPAKKITMNISPGYIQKRGTGYDLACAIALLQAFEIIKCAFINELFFVGELSLTGDIKAVNGVLPMLIEGKKKGMRYFVVSSENYEESRRLEGIYVFPAKHLKDAIFMLMCDSLCTALKDGYFLLSDNKCRFNETIKPDNEADFSYIKGQKFLKRACEVAASGMHNLLMIGPPGTGKSLVAKAIGTILPDLSESEALDVASIYSIAGLFNGGEIAVKRPYRSPHHSITMAGLVGGGNPIRPGEISLSNHGVLFLDELPEFKKQTLEVLRQPLEERRIRITRANGTYDFPADFSLIAAMNPCPCGYYPDLNRCMCSKTKIDNYLNHISGPLLNRIDLCVEVPEIAFKDMESSEKCETSADIRKRVTKTINIQKKRYIDRPYNYNSQLSAKDMQIYCKLEGELYSYMEEIYEKMKLGARAYHRILKVSRTIADMEGHEKIEQDDLNEALLYRGIMDRYWGDKK